MAEIYKVEWTETLSRTGNITADSLSEAISKARELYFIGDIVLGAEDYAGGAVKAGKSLFWRRADFISVIQKSGEITDFT